jgi:hypothetical protein
MYLPRVVAFNSEISSAGFSTIWKWEIEEEKNKEEESKIAVSRTIVKSGKLFTTNR